MGQVLAEGDAAPDFVLLGIEGTPVQFKDFARRKLVLYFYPKDDTSGCTKQAIGFNAMRAEFAAAGPDTLGVSPDSMASHTKFRKKYDLALPLASDEAKHTLNAYGVWTQKSMYGRKIYGRRAHDLPDQGGQNCPYLAQSVGAGPRPRSARSGK